MERGPHGGIVLADGYRRALAQFTVDELQSLFAAGAGPMADLGISSHREALRKLAGALPAAQRAAADTARERLLLDHKRWGRSDQPTALLARLRRAIDDAHQVRLDYRDRTGAVTDRVVDPLGLVAKAGVWYLIARDGTKGYRTFRAQRLIDVHVLARSFTRPADFDLEAYWQTSVAAVQRHPETHYPVVVRVANEALGHVGTYWACEVVAQDAESATLRIAFPTRESAVAELMSWRCIIEIISPPEVIVALVDYARAIVHKYTVGASNTVASARVH
jgi:predicted DNA-binding transcriptional regulator YafY